LPESWIQHLSGFQPHEDGCQLFFEISSQTTGRKFCIFRCTRRQMCVCGGLPIFICRERNFSEKRVLLPDMFKEGDPQRSAAWSLRKAGSLLALPGGIRMGITSPSFSVNMHSSVMIHWWMIENAINVQCSWLHEFLVSFLILDFFSAAWHCLSILDRVCFFSYFHMTFFPLLVIQIFVFLARGATQ